jgi:hypothetical protein
MDRHHTILRKLTEVTEDEWLVVIGKCEKVVDLRTKNRRAYGAHSERNLEVSPFEYYFQLALDKLYQGAWDWQFEEYSLAEQMTRIVGSLISEEVRKYKAELKRGEVLILQSYEALQGALGELPDENDTEEREEVFQKQLNSIMQAIEGDDEAELLFMLLQDGKTNKEICAEMTWTKNQLYNISERMRTKARKLTKINASTPKSLKE